MLTLKLTLTLISFFIFIVYLVLVLRYIGDIPRSLSETYYYLGSPHYPRSGWAEMKFNRLRASIFTLMMWDIAFTLLPVMLDITPEGQQFLAFLALAAICFVGAAPEFKEKYEGRVHTTAAVIAAVVGLAWSILVAHGYIPLIASLIFSLAAGFATATLKYGLTFWLELVAFNTVYFSLILVL